MIDIVDKKECCGCGACANVCPKKCIEMKLDEEGFFYPVVNKGECVQCNICEKVCPIKNPTVETTFAQDAYVVQHRDGEILRESTAGGAFTAIANFVLRRNGVVFGVSLSDDFKAHHVWVDKEDELGKFRNSKYMQSCIGDAFKEVKSFLHQGRKVCFSGTPCQVEGLKYYLGKEYENLLTVDVVCRAVPSPMVFKKYLEYQEENLGSPVRNIRFRDKYYGYKYSTMNVKTDKNQGNYHQGVEIDPWLRAFFSGVCLRPSCYQCQFKKRYRMSDFTIWDCFNVGRFSKELDNDKGATRVLIHTDKGREVFREISSELKYIQLSAEKIIDGTSEMKQSVKYNAKRESFMRDAAVMDGVTLFKKYFPNTFKTKLEHIVRMICYKIGIYSMMKKIYVRITHKY